MRHEFNGSETFMFLNNGMEGNEMCPILAAIACAKSLSAVGSRFEFYTSRLVGGDAGYGTYRSTVLIRAGGASRLA
jgi:hypothetical protein